MSPSKNQINKIRIQLIDILDLLNKASMQTYNNKGEEPFTRPELIPLMEARDKIAKLRDLISGDSAIAGVFRQIYKYFLGTLDKNIMRLTPDISEIEGLSKSVSTLLSAFNCAMKGIDE